MKHDVLDHGYVRLVDVMGSDLSVVNSARTSYDKEVDELRERDIKLIHYLIRDYHDSPLRHASMTFEVYAPLMVARQWWKHVVASTHLDDSEGWNESCLPGWQRLRARGEWTDVEHIFNGKRPLLFSLMPDYKIKTNKVADCWEAGYQDVLTIENDYGDDVSLTANHRVRTKDGYLPAGMLKVGHEIGHVVGIKPKYGERRITAIKPAGRHMTYDISMEGYPNFMADHTIVHNSRRYVTEEPTFYVPEFRAPPASHKQGSEDTLDYSIKVRSQEALVDHYERSLRLYNDAMDSGVAPEQARLFLPAYGLYVRWRWTASLNAVLNFMTLRLGEGAQHEITEYAVGVNKALEQHFPHTTEAWKKYRVY